MKILDAFCGSGGIHLGLVQGLTNAKVVVGTDIDKNVGKQYQHMFPETEYLAEGIQSILSLNKNRIPPLDLFAAGFPCQPWSLAGKRKGFDDERGQIMFTMLDVIEMTKPKIIFLENVKNFQTICEGKPFATLMERLALSGYNVSSQVMNTCEYTHVPQNRERLFIVGFLDKQTAESFVWPTKLSQRSTVESSGLLQPFEEVDSKYHAKDTWKIFPKLLESVVLENTIYQYRRFYMRENKGGLFPTLTANMGGGGHNVPFILQNGQIRKLTPLETFRAQGYPDDFKFEPSLSDNALYKMAGNSVSVPLIQMIAQEIQKAIDASD